MMMLLLEMAHIVEALYSAAQTAHWNASSENIYNCILFVSFQVVSTITSDAATTTM